MTLLIIKIFVTKQSIVGITYHDEFNFEDKYRNVNECNPFYWHPLHLPEQCAEMYANLIRSRAASAVGRPVRIVTRKERPKRMGTKSSKLDEDIYFLRRYYKYNMVPEYDHPIDETEYIYDDHNDDQNDYTYEEQFAQEELIKNLSPYDKMLELLKIDISKNPAAPVVGMSNYGPIAMYRQPISKKSKVVINKITRAYARANKEASKNEDGYFYGKIEYPSPSAPENSRNVLINHGTDTINYAKPQNEKKKL